MISSLQKLYFSSFLHKEGEEEERKKKINECSIALKNIYEPFIFTYRSSLFYIMFLILLSLSQLEEL